jgi:hypothetical protein
MRRQKYYMAVQVCSRLADGRISQWYPQEQCESLRKARSEAMWQARLHPGLEYQVVRVTTEEIGEPKIWNRPDRKEE